MWTPTIEQVAQVRDAVASREAFGSQREMGDDGSRESVYAAPQVFCQVEVLGALGTSMDRRGSGALEVRDGEAEVTGPPGERYELELPDGSTREGTLDEEGRAVEAGVPPGRIFRRFPDLWAG